MKEEIRHATSRRRRLRLAIIAAVGASALFVGCAGPAPEPAQEPAGDIESMEPIVLSAQDVGAPQGTVGLALTAFADEITEKTGGKISFDLVFSSALAPPPEALAAIGSGLVDVGYFATPYTPQVIPVGVWAGQVANSIIPSVHPTTTMVGTPASGALFVSNEDVQAEFAALDVVPLIVTISGPFPMLCTEPVETVAQAQGVAVTHGGSPWKEAADHLGMTSAVLPVPEVFEAVQRGLVSCVIGAPNQMVSGGLLEVAGHLSMIESEASFGYGIGMNKEIWDALPSAAQRIIFDATATYYRVYIEETFKTFRAMVETADELGVEIHDAAEINEVLVEFAAQTRAGLLDRAPKGVSDAAEFVTEFESLATEWTDELEEIGIDLPERTGDGDVTQVYLNTPNAIDWHAFDEALRKFLSAYAP